MGLHLMRIADWLGSRHIKLEDCNFIFAKGELRVSNPESIEGWELVVPEQPLSLLLQDVIHRHMETFS